METIDVPMGQTSATEAQRRRQRVGGGAEVVVALCGEQARSRDPDIMRLPPSLWNQITQQTLLMGRITCNQILSGFTC